MEGACSSWTVFRGFSRFILISTFFVSYIYVASAQKEKVLALQLPPYIGKGCKANDPKLNECVVKKGTAAIKAISKGDPKYKIPSLDPLTINEIRIDQGTKQVGMSLKVNDCKMYGLQNTKLVNANVDLKNSHCQWDLELDKLTILGKYNVTGQVLLLPIFGAGDANMTVSGAKFSYIYDWDLVRKSNGLDYVHVTNNSLPFEVANLKVKLSNLFNGDRLLGDNMNEFLNEHWREIMQDLGPEFSRALGEIFRKTLTAMAEVVPLKNIFPTS